MNQYEGSRRLFLEARNFAKYPDNMSSDRISRNNSLRQNQESEPDDMLLPSNGWLGNYMDLSAAAAIQPTAQSPVSAQEKARLVN
jgi:hypothetical protein